MNRRDSPSTGLFVRQSDRDWVEVISGSRVSSGHDESGPALAGWNPVEEKQLHLRTVCQRCGLCSEGLVGDRVRAIVGDGCPEAGRSAPLGSVP